MLPTKPAAFVVEPGDRFFHQLLVDRFFKAYLTRNGARRVLQLDNKGQTGRPMGGGLYFADKTTLSL